MKSRLLYEISQISYFDWTKGLDALKEARPDIAKCYPNLGTIASLTEVLDRLQRRDTFVPPVKRKRINPRNLEIKRLKRQGLTNAAIASMFGISAERVRQILEWMIRHSPET